VRRALKRRRLIPFGDAGGVKRSFGIDASDAVLLSGSAPDRHHNAAIDRTLVLTWGSG
jgi:hypothetical protein